MPKMTISLPEELKRVMKLHSEISWDEIAGRSICEYAKKIELAEEIASKSKLDPKSAEEIGIRIKEGIAKKYREV